MAAQTEAPFAINVGPLTSLGSLCQYTAKPLREFTRRYMAGQLPAVEWDLRNVESRKMNMASLTGFLSLADRMHKFIKRPAIAKARWNPHIFAFWDAISFLAVASELDLIDWYPPNIIGGYSLGDYNPNTKIRAFPFDPEEVPPADDIDAVTTWKEIKRKYVKEDLELWCGPLFRPRQEAIPFDRKLSDQLALTTAELIVNALLWGRTTAFLGMQRTSKRVTVAVCDCGMGFLRTLREKSDLRLSQPIRTHSEACLVASLFNAKEWGLRRAIDTVVGQEGWVVVSSSSAEIRWEEECWKRAIALTQLENGELTMIPSVREALQPWSPQVAVQSGENGYYREYDAGLRGVRISFEVPIRNQGRRF